MSDSSIAEREYGAKSPAEMEAELIQLRADNYNMRLCMAIIEAICENTHPDSPARTRPYTALSQIHVRVLETKRRVCAYPSAKVKTIG
jgi:hypothetical protein